MRAVHARPYLGRYNLLVLQPLLFRLNGIRRIHRYPPPHSLMPDCYSGCPQEGAVFFERKASLLPTKREKCVCCPCSFISWHSGLVGQLQQHSGTTQQAVTTLARPSPNVPLCLCLCVRICGVECFRTQSRALHPAWSSDTGSFRAESFRCIFVACPAIVIIVSSRIIVYK